MFKHARRRLALGGLVLAAFVLSVAGFAGDLLAQAATSTPASSVDLSAIISQAESILFACIAAVLTWGAHRLISIVVARTHISIGDAQRALVDVAVSNGVAWAQHVLADKLAGKTQIEIRNALVAEVVSYAAPKIPDALAYFGIDQAGLAQRAAAAVTKSLGGDPLLTVPAK